MLSLRVWRKPCIAGPSKRGSELSSHPPASLRETPATLNYLLLFKFAACLQWQLDLTSAGHPVRVRPGAGPGGTEPARTQLPPSRSHCWGSAGSGCSLCPPHPSCTPLCPVLQPCVRAGLLGLGTLPRGKATSRLALIPQSRGTDRRLIERMNNQMSPRSNHRLACM